MKPTPHALVLGTKGDDRNLLARCTALGIRVTLIQQKELLDNSQIEHASEVIAIDYNDRELLLPIARVLHARHHFDAVLSLTEPAIIAAAMVNDELGLRGSSLRTVQLLQDKWKMRRLLDQVGLSPVRARLGATAADVDAFIAEVGPPIILKPVDGGASMGVTRITGQADIPLALDRLQALGHERFILEEFLEGTEVSAEAFSFAGEHRVIAVTDKLTGSNFVELGHSMPSQLSATDVERIITLVEDFLDVVGLADGPSHTEVILTASGPRIVESHNRIGGDKINDLVTAAYGVDLASLAFAWACRIADPLPAAAPAKAGAAVRFIAPAWAGRIREIRGLDVITGKDGVVLLECRLRVGETAPALESNHSRSGCIVVRAGSASEAIAKCEEYLTQISVLSE